MAYTRKHTRKAPVRRTRGGKNPVKFPRGARLGKGAVSLNNAIARNAANAAAAAAARQKASNNAAMAAARAAANASPLRIENGSVGSQSGAPLQQPQFNSSGNPIVNLNAARRQGQPNAVQLPAAGPLQLQSSAAENAARAAANASPLRIGNAPRNAKGNPILRSPNGWENHGPVARNFRPGVLPSGPTIQLPNAARGANGKPVNSLEPSYPQSGQSPNYNLNSSFGKIKAEHNFVKSWANSMKTKINGLLAPPAAAAAGGSRRRSRKMRR